MSGYFIVQFKNEEVELVPENWLISENICQWPGFRNPERLSKAIIRSEVPDPKWEKLDVKRLNKKAGNLLTFLVICCHIMSTCCLLQYRFSMLHYLYRNTVPLSVIVH